MAPSSEARPSGFMRAVPSASVLLHDLAEHRAETDSEDRGIPMLLMPSPDGAQPMT